MKLYSFCDSLKRARKEAGYTQKKLADKLGVHVKTVMNWDQGVATPSIDILLELTEIYNCDLDYLVGRIYSKDHGKEYIRQETGLSENAVTFLKGLNAGQKFILNQLLSNDSGMDSLLQNFAEAKEPKPSISSIEYEIDREIIGYNSAGADHSETKLSFSPFNGVEEELIFRPGENTDQLTIRKKDICRNLDSLQLAELNQHKNKINIRMLMEQMMDKFIPPAKSQKYPDPEKEKEKYR